MEIEFIIIGAAISINALVLLVTSVLSYLQYKNKKLLFVIAVFVFFLVRGILLSLSIFHEAFEPLVTSFYPWLVDVVILNLLYLAALKR
jgi:hypothetical protein